jgi:hypothetical protein
MNPAANATNIGARCTPSLNRYTLVLGCLWLAFLTFYFPRHLHPDVSWYLIATERMLDGAVLYRDIIEINPPLAFYLTVLPIVGSRLLGIAAQSSFVTYVFLVIALSLTLVNVTLRTTDLSPRVRFGILLAMFAGLVVLPMPVFGEREHLAAILCLPYICLCASKSWPSKFSTLLALFIGAFAAAGFGLKPHFLIVPVALEIFLAFDRRAVLAIWRPEVIGLIFGIVAYLFAVLWFHPDYLEFIAPIGMLVYGAYSAPFLEVLTRRPPLLCLVAVLYLLARRAQMADRLTQVFGISTVGFLFSYLIQSKGWDYHMLPAAIMAWLTATAILLRCWQSAPSARRGLQKAMIALAVTAMILILIPPLSKGPFRHALPETLLPYVQKYASGGSIYAFTSHVWVAFPLVNEAGVEWASRFPTQWLLPGALRRLAASAKLDRETEQRLRDVEAYATEAVIEDFAAMPPDLVIIDKDNPYFGDVNFDNIAYFNRDPRFEELWRSYVKLEELRLIIKSKVRRFEVWCRRYGTHSCEA